MFTKEFYEVFVQIIKSWQVIVVAIVIFLYLKIVSYVSKSYHRPKQKKMKRIKNTTAPAEIPEEGGAAHSSNDELGLEEA